MEPDWIETREAFEVAAHWFVDTASAVGDRWHAPGLGEWDVRALVGHTTRSFLTIEDYLGKPPTQIDVFSAPGYYLAIRSMTSGPAVTQRGVDAGRALGDDPVAAVRGIADRVLHLVQASTGEELLTSIAGGMRLIDYLPTRTFELVVHTCDLAVALSLPMSPPSAAARAVMQVATEVVIDDGQAGEVLLALTGRRSLPEGFSLV